MFGNCYINFLPSNLNLATIPRHAVHRDDLSLSSCTPPNQSTDVEKGNEHDEDDVNDVLVHGCVRRQLESQPTVDDSENKKEAAKPDVGLAFPALLLRLDVLVVVQDTEDGLNTTAKDDECAEPFVEFIINLDSFESALSNSIYERRMPTS